MTMKIYTKTGDKGKTSLIGGTKVPKSDIRIEAYGSTDELNSFIGLLKDQIEDNHACNMLKEVQDRLFTIGSMLASDNLQQSKMKIPVLKDEDVTLLEIEIDAMEAKLPDMKNFILPGGHPTVSTIHIVRSVCRRSERKVVKMVEQRIDVEPLVIKYLNRLSDYLFVLARFIARQLKAEEIIWKPRL